MPLCAKCGRGLSRPLGVFSLIKVSGDSMTPTILNGDILIITKPRALRAGLIYVVNHSDLGRIVKRVSGFDARGRVRLEGDNPASTSANLMGTVEPARLIGRAVFVIGKSGLRKL